MFRTVLRSTVLFAVCCFAVSATEPGQAAFPENYRNWTHVKSVLIGPPSPAFQNSGGLHHIYANEQAMVGYRTGKFPAGSMIAFDLLEVGEKDGITSEGARVRIDVMHKDNHEEWHYARFMKGDPAARVTDQALIAACAACHSQQKDHDSVFSTFRP